MEDPRTVFFIPDDRQVVVYMEWEGPPGKHRIEALWKDPAGKPTVFSELDYDAKDKQFGAYFTLALTDSVETGSWTLDAHIDGESAGSHTFQIMNGKRPADAIPERKPLTTPQLYERGLQSSVGIEALDRSGRSFRVGSGFLLEPGMVATTFENIDGAANLRLSYSDGTRTDTDQVVAWNRRQDWAVLKVNPTKLPVLHRAAADSWNIGDTSFYLDAAAEGNRVITTVSIDGKNAFPRAGMRISISIAPAERSFGGGLLNEYGEVIGIVGGGIIPGAAEIRLHDWIGASPSGAEGGSVRGGLAVPITMVPTVTPEMATTLLSALDAKGEFLAPVTAGRNVVYGQLSRTLNNSGGLPFPADGGTVFSKRDATIHVYVMWQGREKAKGFVTLRVFDLENRLLNRAALDKPMKFSISPGEQRVTTWAIPTASFPPGIYRVDVWFDEAPAWRSFWKLSE